MGQEVCPRYPNTQYVFLTEGHLSPKETAPAHTHLPTTHTYAPAQSSRNTLNPHTMYTQGAVTHTHSHT